MNEVTLDLDLRKEVDARTLRWFRAAVNKVLTSKHTTTTQKEQARDVLERIKVAAEVHCIRQDDPCAMMTLRYYTGSLTAAINEMLAAGKPADALLLSSRETADAVALYWENPPSARCAS